MDDMEMIERSTFSSDPINGSVSHERLIVFQFQKFLRVYDLSPLS